MGRAIAAIALLLLLTGCVPTREVPTEGASDEELRAYTELTDRLTWESLGFAEEDRPTTPEIEYVDEQELSQARVDCMTGLGYSGYEMVGEGYQLGDYEADEGEAADWYICQASYHADLAAYELPGRAQLEYLYEYNLSTLVPCLEAHGVVVDTAPTREDAVAIGSDWQGWNPYYWLRDFDPTTSAADRHTFESCPAYPAGEAYDPYRELW